MNSFMRNLVVWVVLGSLMVYVFNNIENSSAREQISYSQFKQEVFIFLVPRLGGYLDQSLKLSFIFFSNI